MAEHPVQKDRRFEIVSAPTDDDLAVLHTVVRFIRERVKLARDLAHEMEQRRARRPARRRRRSRVA